jgi:hypothetical protein
MKRLLQFVAMALAFCITPTEEGLSPLPSVHAANCTANENLGELAGSFISRCRKASIHREFPRELLLSPLGLIKSGGATIHKKAWKLLNDRRFAK